MASTASTVSVTRDVAIRDVTPRDGLQAEAPVATDARVDLCRRLAGAGVADVEAASFVSPRAVPSMADAATVVAALDPLDANWWALVPNARGAELALAAGIRRLTVTVSASDGYSRANVGRGTDEAVAGLSEITIACRAAGSGPDEVRVDVVVSCCFGSPYDDVVDPGAVAGVVAAVVESLPGARVTLADTTGTATPRRIAAVLSALSAPAHDDLGLHLHDTRGTALANALSALDRGVRRFDTSTGGLGGSPFAPGAGGNLATEDLVLVLEDMGVRTGVDLDAVLAIARSLPGLIGHDVPSRTSAAGPLARFAGS
jgi:hydroxymethylglutaryl-CoA lyase